MDQDKKRNPTIDNIDIKIQSIIDVYKSTFNFKLNDSYRWNPETRTINYAKRSVSEPKDASAFLHELSHGILEHQDFEYDVDLLRMEMQAWELAARLAAEHCIEFHKDYSQACLESYRVWIAERSTCPECDQTTLESAPQSHYCFNCSTSWKVSKQQMCQIQRRRL